MAEFRLWKIGGAVLRQPNQIEFEWQQTWQANDEVMYCPEGRSRAYVLPMAILVDRTRKIAAHGHALANTHLCP
jgi:hypothetical protein